MHKKRRKMTLTAMLLALFLTCGYTAPVFAQSGETTEKDPVVTVEETGTEESRDETAQAAEEGEGSGALTPEGALTLVDDLDTKATKDLQFLTVTTRDGSYYYIIIDRSGNSENVYFLNAVDTVDLMNLMNDEEKVQLEEEKTEEAVIIPEENLEQKEKEPDIDQKPEKESENQIRDALPILGIFGGIGILILAAYYLLKIRPKKNANSIDEDREFYDDEEYENEDETEEEEETEEGTEQRE